MQFSVLMAVYWKEVPERFARALESTFQQSLVPDEVVIVKDGPLTAELDVIIEKYESLFPDKLNVIALEKNMGPAHAWRIGLDACKYEHVAKMDSDDVCLPNRFEKQIRYLEVHPEIDVLGGGITEFADAENNIFAKRLTPLTHEEILKYSKMRSPVNHVTVILRRAAVVEAGSFLPLFGYFGYVDYYLWVRMLKEGARFANLPDILVNVHAGREMMQRRGGLKYYLSDIRFQKEMYHIGYVNILEMGYNIAVRTIFRAMPSGIRRLLYKVLLRD